jgi:hypothetical protein
MISPKFLALKLRFHPVGQGLFTSGCIRSFDQEIDFNWAYDCGTTSSQKLVAAATDSLKSETNAVLDLVTISHFDRDHISGLVELLNRFKVKNLLLPYMPLWQRLHCAFVEGIDTQSSLIGLFIDPVAYILALDSKETIQQIVFVPPSTDSPDLGELPQEGEDSDVLFEFGDPPADAGNFWGAQSKLKWLKSDGKIQLKKVWEFVPYNDAGFKPENVDNFS